MLDTTTRLEDVLYPPIEAHEKGHLVVTELHTIAWERSGNPEGIPVIVIHGGPGGGGQPSYRQYFDPAAFDIIQFDQRGCGQSTPHAELEDNNTQALVGDIEQLREHLGVEKWHVFGGSWGSTLSLIYAQHHPDRAISLVLRGIFMCRKSELRWFYQDGASHLFPDAFEPYRNHIPEGEQDDLITAYYARLTSKHAEVRRAAAKEWTRWEMATSRLFPDPEYLEKAEDLDFAVAFARIECHYFINAIFVEEAHILNQVASIQHIPTVIVQGRYDVVCPPRSAWELHKALPQSKLVMVGDAGHSMGEVSIARELVKATNALR
ncbi:MAG: prolyl aminopeptidase [Candidatus Poseidonia sp.]|jgi:proline iminopeptidase|nr:prolyl aminopeptidase [Poseidonia sp.]MBL6806694.1 prolyl aminopeptidase [Poseidonia sp.]MBL6885888.1 prolyl aminopeptidase [Poseidonia sp.]MBL6892264.1 prolyl aminopeptidase [Poseidonia sp.]